jgi:hypothetical protein
MEVIFHVVTVLVCFIITASDDGDADSPESPSFWQSSAATFKQMGRQTYKQDKVEKRISDSFRCKHAKSYITNDQGIRV